MPRAAPIALIWLVAAVAVPGAGFAAAAAAPQRVISMNPSLSAILLALDAGDLLVGVDEWSSQSLPAVTHLPTVGGLANPSLERVVSLRPDLVVLVPSVEQRDFRGRLGELGIPVLEEDPRSFEQVLATIRSLGRAVGRGQAADDRVAAIRRARSEVASAVSDLPRPRTVLVLQRDPLFVVGSGSFIADMLDAAGGDNAGRSLGGAYPRVSLEWLVAAAPEVILDSSDDPTPMAEYWAHLPSLPAVGSGRLVRVARGSATLPGPWLDRALWILARALHCDGADESEAPACLPRESHDRDAVSAAQGGP